MTGHERIEFTPTPNGLRITDEWDKSALEFSLSQKPTLQDADTEPFRFTVDEARTTETSFLELSVNGGLYIRESDGTPIHHFTNEEHAEFDRDSYLLAFGTAPKTYVRVTSALTVTGSTVDDVFLRVEFPDTREISIGSRSNYNPPEHTITTTTEIEDLFTVVSHMGSSIREWSPERSYPTFRRFPPSIQVGDELDIPDECSQPDTGVTIGIPKDLDFLYPVAPLAYYLGATIEPSDDAFLRLRGRREVELSHDDFENRVSELVKHIFTLDSAVRTAGYIQLETAEADGLRDAFNTSLEEVYQQPYLDILDTYLDIPRTKTRPYTPPPLSEAVIEPSGENVPSLPYLLHRLAVIQTTPVERGESEERQPIETSGLTRSAASDASPSITTDDIKSLGDSPQITAPDDFVTTELWVGCNAPPDGVQFVQEGFDRRVHQAPREGGADVQIVCNDDRMQEELEECLETYSSRDDIEADVSVNSNLSVDELAALIEDGCEFFHYIGHTTEEGLQCRDGYLDISTVEESNVLTFFLNSCSSQREGVKLVRRGSIGGIVTHTDVPSAGAVQTGARVADLLNHGYPLRHAYLIVRATIFGQQYQLVGDGAISVVPSREGIYENSYMMVDTESDDGVSITSAGNPIEGVGIGGITTFLHGSNRDELTRTVCPVAYTQTGLTREEAQKYVHSGRVPLRVDGGSLQWSDEVEL